MLRSWMGRETQGGNLEGRKVGVWVRWREAEARPRSMVQAEEFLIIRRGMRSHWKVSGRKVTASHWHFDKTALAAAWRMECRHPPWMDKG